MVQVQDHDSHPRRAKVMIQNYPAKKIVNSGPEITIMNGDLFKRVAVAARLKKNF